MARSTSGSLNSMPVRRSFRRSTASSFSGGMLRSSREMISRAGVYSTPAGTTGIPKYPLPSFCRANRYSSIWIPSPYRTSDRSNAFWPVL